MRRLILLFTFIGMPLLSGCTSWTEFGQGGAAEDNPPTEVKTDAAVASYNPRELRQDLNHNQRHLDVLVMEGANQCFPASVHLAKLRENRIAREIAGELYEDAENNLIIQRLDLNRIERKLEAVVTEASCWTSTPLHKSEEASDDKTATSIDTPDLPTTDTIRLFNMLNSDNQFALNSNQINPKYADNLISACELLVSEPDLKLNIVGHSDASGKTDYNASLSFQRTMAVVKFLTDCKVDPARINPSFEGDAVPLYSGRSPAIDLVNRRVSIELIPAKDRKL
jgi:outer membrane protein OmpA-like peptidoglycan-associated protein